MTKHLDKSISNISYNFLNLPYQVTQTGGNTNYVYRTDGLKVKKTYGTKVTDYSEGFQYENAVLQFMPTAEGYYDFANSRYTYNYTDHLGNVRLSYYKNPTTGSAEALEENNYYPFGLKHSGYNNIKSATPSYQYNYNGKELQETGMYDYGARFYMPDIGRWGVVDPKSELLESSSPYVYALNSPILYLDKDGELPILINGRVSSDSERGNASYWGKEIINTIKGSGIPNPGGEFHYVDGDRGINNEGIISKDSPTWPQDRNEGGKIQAKKDWNTILSKLEKDPKTGKIIEKIQIYTHSRGAAFGEGYTEQLLQLIKDNSSKFQDANNEIEFVFDMAPHQSGYLTAVKGVSTYTMDHAGDSLSDNDKSGVKAAFSSKEGGNWGGGHRIATFKNDLAAFTKSFMKGTTKQNVIDNFVKTMKDKYGVEVTVKQ